ncbi:MAG: hypothetical protein NT030_05515 [Candidatus Saganbacteria bacterium]|nr:hypothetical protein [Candidatus Saganbacteria bacterium]
MLLAILGLLLPLGMAWSGPERVNLLKNGSFDEGLKNKIPLYWGKEFYNCYIVKDEITGGNALKIVNTKKQESMGAQEIDLDGRKIHAVTLSTLVKGENILAGKESWEKANMQLLFFDEGGKQLGGWPQLGPWDGTFDWREIKRNFIVPRETRKCKVVLGLLNASGAVYFDDVYLEEFKREDFENLISNGDFEIWEDWAYGGAEGGGQYIPGYKSDYCLRISNPAPMWSFASQSIPLDGKKVKKIVITGSIKLDNVVPGAKPWQKARINIEFKDRSGKRLGGWPIVEEATGTFDWKEISNQFSVPEDTRRVDIFAGLMECSGAAYFDDLRMEGFDSAGNKVVRGGTFVTDTSGWYKFEPPVDKFNKNAVDVSFLLDPPAGKHGFLSVKNGHFYFADGTRAKFWGTNIYGTDCFPDHKAAERIAERLAKFGCNLVRLHHMDAFWSDPNIFDPKFNDTQHLSAQNLEKLDYLVWQLKKKGIYVFVDLLVDREFKEGDNVADYKKVERGAKITGFYNKRIIDLQKKFAKDLLTHYNPYTKKRYIDDPAIVSVKLINEAMLFYISTQFGLSEYYLGELDSLWNGWLLKKYGNRANLKAAWTDKYGRCDLEDAEDPKNGSVKRGDTSLKFQRSGFDKIEPLRQYDTMAFYYDTQVKYYDEMKKFLKGIGVRVPVSGSNHWLNIAADVKSNASLDYIDRHRYWDHPQFGYGIDVVFEDQPMLKYPEEALPNNFAFYKVAGVPFVISEWNCSFPNEFRAEGPMVMAAYSCLQDFDGVLQFAFSGAQWGALMKDNFDIGSWPNVLTEWAAAALIFYRGDVSIGRGLVEEKLSDKDIFGPIFEDQPIADEPLIPLITKTQRSFVKEQTERRIPDVEALLSKYNDKEKGVIKSDTGELFWNYKDGIFKIDTERTEGALGFIGGEKVELGSIEIQPKTDYCSIFVSSRGNEPISSSSSLLLTATARVENTGQKYNESKTQLKEVGLPPILIEGVEAKIKIKRLTLPFDIRVYALDINGDRKKSIDFRRLKDGIEFDIRGSDKSVFYEIVMK